MAKTCFSLNTRQFYFEPNPYTAHLWKQKGLFASNIDTRAMFICESPGPSAEGGEASKPEQCWVLTTRDKRFQEARNKYRFDNCYITNTVKCGVRADTRHSYYEIDACKKFLVKEIELIKPQVIVAVGGNAYKTIRSEVMELLSNHPILYKITHYSCRGNPWPLWDNEFSGLIRLFSATQPSR